MQHAVERDGQVANALATRGAATLYVCGEESAAQVRMDGTKAAIEMVSQTSWRL